jgi:hypothetical protein
MPGGQPPQSIAPPQPSPITPQYLPVGASQIVTSQAPESRGAPQRFEMPAPPQVKSGFAQLPQLRKGLQPHPVPI